MRRAPWVALFVLTLAVPARAADEGAADVLFKAGREAMKEERYEDACRDFEESQGLDPAIGTLLNLALCEDKLDRVAKAWTHVHDVLGALEPDDDREAVAVDLAARLAPRVAWVTLTVPQGVTLLVKLDDVTVSSATFGYPRVVDPGSHVVTAYDINDHERRIELDVAKGERRTVVVEPPEIPHPIEPAKAAPVLVPVGSPPVKAVDHPSSSPRTAGWIVGGAGLGVFAFSMVAGYVTLRAKDVVDAHCPGKSCDPEGMSAASRGRTWSALSTGAFVVGLAGMGVGGYLLLSTPSANAGVQAQVYPAGGALSAFARF